MVANLFLFFLFQTANQETIVELMGFANRVFPKAPNDFAFKQQSMAHNARDMSSSSAELNDSKSNDGSDSIASVRTEITFDFHRLNVLVLRAIMRENFVVGRKVGTFTMSEARIHATLGSTISVEGSLGGLQVIDLTPEGISHQRILSVGKDPLTESINPPTEDLLNSLTQEVYGIGKMTDFQLENGQQAFSFYVSRDLSAMVTIKIRMASVWLHALCSFHSRIELVCVRIQALSEVSLVAVCLAID